MAKLVCRITQIGIATRIERLSYSYHTLVQGQAFELDRLTGCANNTLETRKIAYYTTLGLMKEAKLMQSRNYCMIADSCTMNHYKTSNITSFDDRKIIKEEVKDKDSGAVQKLQMGEHLSRKEKINILVNILLDTKDSKEDIYGALDAFVAWEQNFPIGQLKNVLVTLEKEQQWHRVVQVIKWMLSKGQGNTMNTYGQLIRALDMDHRVDEAHEIWVKKIGNDLHSVPWKLSKLMISVYYRNNMMERLVKLFKGFEAFDRKPPEKSIVQKVANAHEILGQTQERDRILEKYKSLFFETESPKKVVKEKNKQK